MRCTMPFSTRSLRYLLGLFLVVVLSATEALAQSSSPFGQQPQFLPVDEAFALGVDLEQDEPRVFWQVADGYYLYRHRLEVELRNGGDAAVSISHVPDGLKTTDEYFGDVEVYYHDLNLRLALDGTPASGAELAVHFQGCAEAGLCYPPTVRYVALTGAEAGSISRTPGGGAGNGAIVSGTSPSSSVTSAAVGPAAGAVTQEGRLAGLLAGENLLLALGLFFLAGIGLTFTPCVLPMVPILASIITSAGGGAGRIGRGRATALSGTYVLAMALTYALIGMLVGFFGGALNLQGWLQSAPVLIVFALIFVLLSLSMFGFYDLKVPEAVRARLERNAAGGGLGGVAVMGVLSSILVSPCISAPLAGALIYLSATGDAVLGGGALFALGLGMGVPLLVVGIGGAELLPRVGAWMNAVKAAFGVLLLGVAIWLLDRLLPGALTLALWAALAIGSGVALGALDFSPKSGAGNVWKASGAMMFVYGVLLLIGAASGGEDPLRPLAPMAGGGGAEAGARAPTFAPVSDLDDVRARVAAARSSGQPVMLSLTADWCISCKLMERNLFPDPEVSALLADFVLIRADVTENNAAQRALLSHFELFGPPSMLFFTPVENGAEAEYELRPYRLQGEIGRAAFTRHLEMVLARTSI